MNEQCSLNGVLFIPYDGPIESASFVPATQPRQYIPEWALVPMARLSISEGVYVQSMLQVSLLRWWYVCSGRAGSGWPVY